MKTEISLLAALLVLAIFAGSNHAFSVHRSFLLAPSTF